jgi:ribonuclease I
VSTSSWGIDEWDDEALHDFADSVIPSIEPLPDPGSLLQRPEWHKRAACRGKGVDEFFPPEGSSLDQPSLKGVWAGTSERARHGMRAAMALG